MNNFFTIDTFPEYIELKNKQGKVAGEDFTPQVFKNLLSFEEWSYIKKEFDEMPDSEIDVQGYSGLGTLNFSMLNREETIAKFEKIASEAVGEELEVLDAGGTRYSTEYGWYPKLAPHYDARPTEIYIFDYHVQSDEDWGVVVEGKTFNFYENEALLFSGTGQVHWREQLKLKDNSRTDLIFFWMQHKKPKLISKQHSDIMKERTKLIVEHIEPMPGLTKEDWYKPIQISDASDRFPDFFKISINTGNPLKHNTVYRSCLHQDAIDNFYNNKTISKDLINDITSLMKNIYTEHNIAFIETEYISYTTKNNRYQKEKYKDNDIVSLAIVIKSDNELNFIIDEKEYNVSLQSGIVFSPTNQIVDIKFDLFLENNSIDLLFFNFILEKGQND
jgi:hypothetical protein